MPDDTTVRIFMLEIPPLVIMSIWLASISSPGSAKEIKNPSTRPDTTTIQSLFFFVIAGPRSSPRGVIPRSTPVRKSVSPRTTNTAPIRNFTVWTVSRGISVNFRSRTITVTGSTEKNTSFNFSFNIFK